MLRSLPLALLASLCLPTSSPGQEADPVPLTWQGEVLEPASIAERVPHAAATVAAWTPFAAAQGYRLVLGSAGRVLLVLRPEHQRSSKRSERPRVKHMLATLAATVAEVEELLGPAAEGVSPVVVIAADEPDYPALLQHIARLDPRLQAWASGRARSVTGFVLSEPLAASWLDDAKGQEEWDPDNELAHRAAQLLLRQVAPQQPPWFALGFGWHVEEAVRESIYCYPYRAGFVWAAEHTGWDKRLKSDFKASRRRHDDLPPVLTMGEVADWDPNAARSPEEREAFDTGRAGIAFGLVRHLATAHPGSLDEVARGFDTAIRDGWKVVISETEWTTDPNYRLPAAKQLEVLQRVTPDILDEATEVFAKGRLKRHPPRH